MEKKIDMKRVEKIRLSIALKKFLKANGFDISNGILYGMAEGTIVVHTQNCDVLIKLITPSNKTGIRYQVATGEDE